MEQKRLEIEEIKAKIYGAFSTCSQTDVNFAMQILELILDQENGIQSKLIQYVCELWATVKSSKEIDVPEIISKAKYERMESLYGEAVDATLLAYTRKGLMEGIGNSSISIYGSLFQRILCGVAWRKKHLLYIILQLMQERHIIMLERV